VKAEPQLRIVLDGPIPVYRQIVDQIRTLCVEGNLQPGATLPSVRQLAANLGVHFNTVAEAYRTLAEEGWLEVRQGRGVAVRERDKPARPSEAVAALHGPRLRHLVAELRANGISPEWIRREIEAALGGNR
jgi:DNA-binding transcriptional regulator YhcF (GntR family)